MTRELSAEAAVAAALSHLLAGHPELGSVMWTIGETPGTLSGRHTAVTGRGEIIDRCAEVMGGTVARSCSRRRGDIDRQAVAQLVTAYQGVPVHVWGTYSIPGPDGLTTDDLADLMAARALGTLVCLPAVAR